MANRTCESCGKHYDSEGHRLDEWLNLCHECNIKKDAAGGASVLWSDRKLKSFYKKLRI